MGLTAKPSFRSQEHDLEASRELRETLGLSASIAAILVQRGLQSITHAREFLDPKLSGLSAPEAMADRDAAADRLARAVRQREVIAIFGDYDVDGTTSTAILADALEAMGGTVRTLVANRFTGGYGFSAPGLERVRQTGATLLVTCDCGSSDHERIEDARRAGIDVIVVDHHLVPKDTLPAFAFLNPHRPECGFSYKGLASAGLALSLAAAVRARLDARLDLRELLDLVALGTIADVAPLDGDNRRLVRAGLIRLAQPRRPGIIALREQAKVASHAPLGAIDVAFRLAPRLNAAGRLSDPTLTVALLRARSLHDARAHAIAIEAINDERKALTRQMTERAIELARGTEGNVGHGIVVACESFHRGVVGIVAARLVDLFGVPAIVIALEGDRGHGSGRTPPGFPLYDAVLRSREDLVAFGGHQAAIGVTVHRSRLDCFRASFADACLALLPKELETGTRLLDVVLDGVHFCLPRASELALLEPLGAANAEPTFAIRDAKLVDAKPVGDGHLKLTVRVGEVSLSCFGWEMGDRLPELGRTVTVYGTLRPDTWRGGDHVEMKLLDVESG